MAIVERARARARAAGLLDTHVIFNDWVPYEERAAYLREADIGVSTHRQHLETRYSFRTRMLDYLWAGLPIVCTEGDYFGDLVQREGLGRAVPPTTPPPSPRPCRRCSTIRTRARPRDGPTARIAASMTWEASRRRCATSVRRRRLPPIARRRSSACTTRSRRASAARTCSRDPAAGGARRRRHRERQALEGGAGGDDVAQQGGAGAPGAARGLVSHPPCPSSWRHAMQRGIAACLNRSQRRPSPITRSSSSTTVRPTRRQHRQRAWRGRGALGGGRRLSGSQPRYRTRPRPHRRLHRCRLSRLPPSWLASLVAAIETTGATGVGAPAQRVSRRRRRSGCVRRVLPPGLRRQRLHAQRRRAARRQPQRELQQRLREGRLLAIGGFAAGLWPGEDVDLDLRLRRPRRAPGLRARRGRPPPSAGHAAVVPTDDAAVWCCRARTFALGSTIPPHHPSEPRQRARPMVVDDHVGHEDEARAAGPAQVEVHVLTGPQPRREAANREELVLHVGAVAARVVADVAQPAAAARVVADDGGQAEDASNASAPATPPGNTLRWGPPTPVAPVVSIAATSEASQDGGTVPSAIGEGDDAAAGPVRYRGCEPLRRRPPPSHTTAPCALAMSAVSSVEPSSTTTTS